MTNELDDLERRIGSAAADLREQLDNSDVPEFRPTNNNGARALAAAALIALIGIIGWPLLNTDEQLEVDTIDVPDDSNTAPTPDSSAEQTAPNQSEVPSPDATELVIGFDSTPPADGRARSELGDYRPDPAYGSSVRRITDAGSASGERVASAFASPDNADGTRLLTLRDTFDWHVVDPGSLASTLLPHIGRRSEPHWHPTDPTRVRHFADEAARERLVLLESTLGGSTDIIADLRVRISALFPGARSLTSGIGQDPAAGELYAWVVRDGEDDILGAVSYDLDDDVIIGSTSIDDRRYGDFESIRVSPSGTHAIVGFVENSIAYDIAFEQARVLDQSNRDGALVAMVDGADALLTVNLGSEPPTGGWIYWIDLDTGTATTLFDLFDNANTSVSFTAAPDRPGWAILSTYICNAPGAWSCDKLMAIHLSSGTLVNLAHTYSCGELDESRPLAVVSRAFDRVYFNSDSGSCSGPIEAFELTIPPDMFTLVSG